MTPVPTTTRVPTARTDRQSADPATSLPVAGQRRVHPAIQRYFEASLYLLMLVGFLTLAGTGKLDAVSLAMVSVALVARAYLLVSGSSFNLEERWTNYFTVAYIAFYLADFFLLGSDFVSATVHLVLFVLVVKIFAVHRE